MFNKNIRTSFATLISASILTLFANTAFAEPLHQPELFKPNNRWKMEIYIDKSPLHLPIPAKIEICFSEPIENEMHQEYAWVDGTGNWHGYVSQEGDQVFMHGNLYRLDFGAEWEISSPDEGGGHLRIWYPEKYYPYWHLNMTLTRMKEECKTPKPPAEPSL